MHFNSLNEIFLNLGMIMIAYIVVHVCIPIQPSNRRPTGQWWHTSLKNSDPLLAGIRMMANIKWD